MNSTKPILTLPELCLHFYALITTFFFWVLIWLGGLVTSKEAGMTVPDWPTSFGYNMFLLPLSQWTGGVLYEHTHRLLATGVGLLTVGLMIILFVVDKRIWMRRLGVVLLLMVVCQGVLGGLRVKLAENVLGLIHGCLGQACLATSAAVCVFTSPWWGRVSLPKNQVETIRPGWIKHVTLVTGLIFLQLCLGATMRAAHAGLSIPDFPTAYGAWWPHVSRSDLIGINMDRLAHHEVPTSLAQIHLQMVHRITAFLILTAVLSSTAMLLFRKSNQRWLKAWNLAWSGLVMLQVILGAWTIWSGKAADIATAHVAIGALLLMIGVIQVLMAKHVNRTTALISG